MSEPIKKPKIVTEQISYGEFNWLGKEYPRNWYQIPGMDVWKDFGSSGGWDMVEKYRKNPSYKCAVVNHLINPVGMYMPGTFVENITKAPEGFVLRKFPACEYIVVTHEWKPKWDMFIVEEAVKDIQIPEGYIKYDNGDSLIRLIEIEHNDPKMGSRWENWIPIQKTEQGGTP